MCISYVSPIITHSKSAYLHPRLHVWGACGRQFESAHPDYVNGLCVRRLEVIYGGTGRGENLVKSVYKCLYVYIKM